MAKEEHEAGRRTGVLGLFLLAVLANVAYSAVYVADVFIQSSGFRASRGRWRLVLLVVGFALFGESHQP